MKLKLGKMTTQEMTEWLGLKNTKTLSTPSGKKRLEDLDFYCKWEKVYGGFNIIEIYDETIVEYVPKSNEKYEFIKKVLLLEWGCASDKEVDSNINVAWKIYNAYPDLGLSIVTIETYVRKARIELYGKPYISTGPRGYSEKRTVKKIGQNGSADFQQLTPEERKIKKELMKEFFTSEDPEQEYQLEDMHNKNEITNDEYMKRIKELRGYTPANFKAFQQTLTARLSCNWVFNATVLHDHPEFAWEKQESAD